MVDSAIKGRRALVTGGSSGIGYAIASTLAGHGARVAIAARTASRLEASAAAIGATPLVADLSSVDSSAELAARTIAALGGVDILVLSSGSHLTGAIADLPGGAFNELLGPNLLAPAALARALAPSLIAARGDILVVNSSIVRAANTRERTYFAASQHAMRAFADGLRDELNEAGVRVTSVYPGTTATPRQQRLHEQSGKPYHPERILQPSDVAAVALAALLLPPTAEVTDVHVRQRYKS